MSASTQLPDKCPNCGAVAEYKGRFAASFACKSTYGTSQMDGKPYGKLQFIRPCSKPSTNPTDWQEWTGGECPVDGETLVEVMFGDGLKHICKAIHLEWGHVIPRQENRIVKYHVFSTPDPEGWIPWPGGEKCPVRDGLEFEAFIDDGHDGNILKRIAPALIWGRVKGIFPITRYRILTPQPLQPPVAEKPWIPDKGDWYQYKNLHMRDWSDIRLAQGNEPFVSLAQSHGNVYRKCKPPASAKPAQWTLTRHLPGFRELREGEEWHRVDGWKEEWLTGGWRPVLLNEKPQQAEVYQGRFWREQTAGMLANPASEGQDWQRTRQPLPAIEPQYRALLPGELVQEGDEYFSDTKEWLKSNSPSQCGGKQVSNYKYRTLRPSTPAKEEAWRPKTGDWYEWLENGRWLGPAQATYDYSRSAFFSKYTFRPCSPPEPSTDELAEKPVAPKHLPACCPKCSAGHYGDGNPHPHTHFALYTCGLCLRRDNTSEHPEETSRCLADATTPSLASELLSRVIKTPTELTTQIEPAMNQTSTTPTPEINLPAAGSRWAVENSNGRTLLGAIEAVSEKGVYFNGKNWHEVFRPEVWSALPRTPLPPTKKELRQLRRQAKAAAKADKPPKEGWSFKRFVWGTTKFAGKCALILALANPVKTAAIGYGLWAWVSQIGK